MIKFKVDYYDPEHEKLLANLSCFSEFEKIKHDGFIIEDQEFHVYSLFREQKNIVGWKNYQELSKRVPNRLQKFNEYFSIEGGVLKSRFTASEERDNSMTDAAGVGVSLSLISRAYGLIEADWEKIPISKKKDLDFNIASTGQEFIELESKGAIVSNTNKKSEISGHAARILAKKKVQRNNNGNKNTLIGIIVSIPCVDGNEAVCRVLDPDSISFEFAPHKYKLLARLLYYFREIRMISKAHFLIALRERIQAIQISREYEIFDKLPLLNLDNEPFSIPASLMTSKSVVGNDIAFGEVFPIGNNEYYYYGFVFDIIQALQSQNYSKIINYKSDIKLTKESNIIARIRNPYIKAIPEEDFSSISKNNQLTTNNNFFETEMRGQLFVTSSGKVVGKCYPSNQIYFNK